LEEAEAPAYKESAIDVVYLTPEAEEPAEACEKVELG